MFDPDKPVEICVEGLPEYSMIATAFSTGAKYSSDIEHHVHVPEKALLAAILERAVRDLADYAAPEDRRSAIAWLSQDSNEDTDYIFSFQNIIHYLHLTESQLREIQFRVRQSDRLTP